jgi:hypothetical protein
MQNILITGGAGYVRHVLTPRLLSERYHVTVHDALYFGCRLPNDPKLRVIKGDIRDTAKLTAALAGQDAVLHLACISNDASFELDERLSETILRLLRSVSNCGEAGGREALRLLLVELGLRRERLAGRDRRSSARPPDAVQQIQGYVRAAALEAPRRRLHLRRHAPGHHLRLQSAYAPRPVRQHPD